MSVLPAGYRRAVYALALVAAATPLVAAASPPQVVAKIPTEAGPCGAVSSFGSVWVASYGTGRLVRIDPRNNRVVQRIRVAPRICPVAAAAGSVWVASDKTDTVYRVDVRRGSVVARVRVAHWPAHLAVGAGAVWVSSYEHGLVARIDARTSRLGRVYRVGGNPSGIAVAHRSLWIAFGRRETKLARVSLASGRLTRIPIRHSGAGFLSALAGSIWTTTADGHAVRVDPAANRVTATFPVPGTPAEVAAAPDGTIWVAEKERNTITRIDPVTNRILDVTGAGPGAFSIAVAAGDMWVTSFAGSDVWRFSAS